MEKRLVCVLEAYMAASVVFWVVGILYYYDKGHTLPYIPGWAWIATLPGSLFGVVVCAISTSPGE